MLISSFWAIEYDFQRTKYDLRCATVSLNLKAFLSYFFNGNEYQNSYKIYTCIEYFSELPVRNTITK